MPVPPPLSSKRLIVEISRTEDERLEGQIRADSIDSWRSFSGVLELLKLIEDLLEDGVASWLEPDATPPSRANPRRQS
jgi:hypothetical protein